MSLQKVDLKSTGSNYQYQITLTQNSYNPNTNKSAVTVEAYITYLNAPTSGASSQEYIFWMMGCTASAVVNGVEYSETAQYDCRYNGVLTKLWSKEIELSHNSDGSLVVPVSGSFTHNHSESWMPPPLSISTENVVLTQTPSYTMDVNYIVDGEWHYGGHEAGTFTAVIGGVAVATDVADLGHTAPVGTSYTITPKTNSGYQYIGAVVGSTWPTHQGTSGVYPAFNFSVVLEFKSLYTISYNANGGSDAPENQTKTYNIAIELSPQVPVREGYTFLGWSVNPNATVAEYTAGDTYYANGNAALYAVWKANTITFKYYSNGANSFDGSAIDPSSQVNILNWTASADSSFPSSHYDYTSTSWAYELLKAGYTGTGFWGTEPSGGTLVHQNFTFESYEEICEQYGVDISTPSTTINIYAQWVLSQASITQKVNGTWKTGLGYIKVNSKWIPAMKIFTKVKGVWKQSK